MYLIFKVPALSETFLRIVPLTSKKNYKIVMFLLIIFSLLRKVKIVSKLLVHIANLDLTALLILLFQLFILRMVFPLVPSNKSDS